MSGSVVKIPRDVSSAISAWAEQAYPHEGCGLLVGRFESARKKVVVRLVSLSNQLVNGSVRNAPTLPGNRQGTGAGKTEFMMDPGEFNRESLKAEKEGLDVVGVVHTHPDHPPRPSSIDASQPFLSRWSNLIVAVEKGKTKQMKAWVRENDDEPFVEESIEVISCPTSK